jgi:histidinol-phosphatase (PHP family)
MKLTSNYHTHTVRCGHASDEPERAYVEAAIAAGMTELGFSDHCPMPAPDGAKETELTRWFQSIRMSTDETEGYVNTLLSLREEYKNDIKLYIGFEVEYLEDDFSRFLDHIRPYPVDYLILGQHFNRMTDDIRYYGAETRSDEVLARHVQQMCDGISTGKFTYVAHPDLCVYRGDLAFYEKQMTKLIECANKHKTPLEINLLGWQTTRNYPNISFWSLASEIGCDVVLGCDAHDTASLQPREAMAYAEQLLDKNPRLNLIEKIKLVSPF